MYPESRYPVSSYFRFFIPRVFIPALLAFFVTMTLMLIMTQLINDRFEEPVDDEPMPIVDIYMEEDVRDIEERSTEIEKVEPTEPPPETFVKTHSTTNPAAIEIPVAPVAMNTGPLALGTFTGNVPIAHLMSRPKYPHRALLRGIEGWVDVRFDVTKQGTTSNVSVSASKPEGVFDKSAISAVKRWKYQPLLDEEGQARAYPGMVQRLVFEIQK